jgi:anti-anti-sigma factor
MRAGFRRILPATIRPRRRTRTRKEKRLSDFEAQVWRSHSFCIEAVPGAEPGSIIFRFTGPFTARDMYTSLPPDQFRRIFETLPGGQQPSAQTLDLSGVLYMDSAGLGMVARLFASAQKKGIRMTITGTNPRVLELFRITRMDAILPIRG